MKKWMAVAGVLLGMVGAAAAGVQWPGELQNVGIFSTPNGFYSGRAEWNGNPSLPGWTQGYWANTTGQVIFIKQIQTSAYGGEGGNGGENICDFSVAVTRASDGLTIDYLGWDDYGPSAPSLPHALGGFIAIFPGDGIWVKARAINGQANLQTGLGIFKVSVSVSIWYTSGQP
jgi:hypothetical protein